ncbi:MAG: rhomboid family intramembrane serine protease [Muribaculaceae bacterium]|nr:rhomboid family intramembrane serine protease [Muribaculaceae bacterium]MDE6008554.1 rhomboid family intramembrane serine protease [Muribaculaceae bacterium]MDE6793450.1 rhomboid family intramembrane serine protease [Muribaculaceae bacterium]
MFQSNRGGFFASIPPVTKNLIIINLIIWLAEALFSRFANFALDFGGLHFIAASDFNPAQFITYMFIHAPNNPAHVIFNMFTLWMFGSTLERIWGSRRYFVFYFICGIGAALVQELVWALTYMHDYISAISRQNLITYDNAKILVEQAVAAGDSGWIANIEMFKNMMITVGASGAVYGLLLGYGFIFPNQPLYLFFIPIPIKAKYMVIGYGVIEFFLGLGNADMVAHFAHLGGMLFGLLVLLYWKKKGTLHGGYY